jgi:SAM-dependent methyltransferase
MGSSRLSDGDYTYVGGELEIFRHARRWKNYYGGMLAPYIKGRVLEVGAGIGATTRVLCSNAASRWVCLEPDASLASRIADEDRREPYPVSPEVVVGTLETLDPADAFDCLLYIDVLEHIADDVGEVRRAADHLAPGGVLVVLCPAHQSLFSDFDRAIGHHRRYDAAMMAALTPPTLRSERIYYLDSSGILPSLANRLRKGKGVPSKWPILLWDRALIPLSRLLDPLFGHRLGKTVVGIWTKFSC